MKLARRFWKGRLAVALSLLIALSLFGFSSTAQAAPADDAGLMQVDTAAFVLDPATGGGVVDVPVYQGNTCNTIVIGETTGNVNVEPGSCVNTTTTNIDNSVTYSDPPYAAAWDQRWTVNGAPYCVVTDQYGNWFDEWWGYC